MQILVTGGTGFIGSTLCRELADRDHDVIAMSRTPGDADLPDGVETRSGDVTDYDSIEGTFEGVDAAVHLVALSPVFTPKGGNERHFEVTVGGTENVVRAAAEHDVSRLVYQSGLGADPDAKTAYLRAKAGAEEAVRGSDLDWVITRPSIVFGEGEEFVPFVRTVTTPYVTGLPGGGRLTRLQPIWVEEFVPMLADCVTETDEHGGETYEFGGPEVLTLADITRLIYRAEGKSVRIVPIPMALVRVGLEVADRVPALPFGPDMADALTLDNVPRHNDVTEFGVDPAALTRLGTYLRNQARAVDR